MRFYGIGKRGEGRGEGCRLSDDFDFVLRSVGWPAMLDDLDVVIFTRNDHLEVRERLRIFMIAVYQVSLKLVSQTSENSPFGAYLL